MELAGKRVLLVGLAKTGLAVARFLKDQGVQVAAADLRTADQLGSDVQDALGGDTTLYLGPHETDTFVASDLIVVSPGVPSTIEPIKAAKGAGISVIGELELAVRYIRQPIIAITGTNGKTTTTKLVGEMLRESGFNVFVGGNIGRPLIDYVRSGICADMIVAEISSFQLDTMESFKPKVGILLNISEDHLDRYSDFQDYIRSKGRLFENQDSTDFAVLNKADPVMRTLEPGIRGQRLYFNINSYTPAGTHPIGIGAYSGDELVNGVELCGNKMICRLAGKMPVTLNVASLKIRGKHNLENAAAASLAALAAGGTEGGIQKVLDTFQGLRHRLEYVRTIDGVRYFNDSKGTNVDAVMRALESFDTPVVLIMGGRDKGGSYARLNRLIRERVKKIIATGEARQKILNALGGLTDSGEATSLEEAVSLAHKAANSGDIVLLSPGCSSFDMFTDYAERGEAYCKAVASL